MPAMASEMPGPSPSRLSAERIAEDDPERVAQQIRSWMQED
jgi:flagellar biosynthesis/type III secretory pathway M-ring protein FliF/YscJ